MVVQKNISQRIAWLQEQTIFLAIFSLWKREWKCARLKRYGQEKNMRRKQELIGVKGLFKNFASELETSLKEGTPRVEVSKAQKQRARSSSHSKGDPGTPS